MESPTALKPPVPTGVLCCTCIDSVLILVFIAVLHLFMYRYKLVDVEHISLSCCFFTFVAVLERTHGSIWRRLTYPSEINWNKDLDVELKAKKLTKRKDWSGRTLKCAFVAVQGQKGEVRVQIISVGDKEKLDWETEGAGAFVKWTVGGAEQAKSKDAPRVWIESIRSAQLHNA